MNNLVRNILALIGAVFLVICVYVYVLIPLGRFFKEIYQVIKWNLKEKERAEKEIKELRNDLEKAFRDFERQRAYIDELKENANYSKEGVGGERKGSSKI
jgi:F0F1-type ATP synthase membrane subunit b/b'